MFTAESFDQQIAQTAQPFYISTFTPKEGIEKKPLRMRTIAECAAMLRQADPDTQLTPNAIRRMVLSGEMPSILVGSRKRLLNYDDLLERFANPPMSLSMDEPPKIRRIDEKAKNKK